MNFKTIRLISAAAALTGPVSRLIPGEGQSFTVPAFSQAEIRQFWLPAVGGVLALTPATVGITRRNVGFLLIALGVLRYIDTPEAERSELVSMVEYGAPIAGGAYLAFR